MVNLRIDDGRQELELDDERRYAEGVGLAYIHYPVAANKLSEDVIDDFRSEILPASLLVHGASGKRSGAMVTMHVGAERGIRGDQPLIEKAQSKGFESDTSELKRFLREYVDKDRG